MKNDLNFNNNFLFEKGTFNISGTEKHFSHLQTQFSSTNDDETWLKTFGADGKYSACTRQTRPVLFSSNS